VVAHGLAFNGKTSFLRDPWNVLDFFIVLISLLVLLASGIPALRPPEHLQPSPSPEPNPTTTLTPNLTLTPTPTLTLTLTLTRPLKQLRILRVLRPLRLLARNEGMKLIITSLFKAILLT